MLPHSSLQLRFYVWWKTILILTESCSNNVAEYNALSIGMQIADEIGIKNLETYGDSKLGCTKQSTENMKSVCD